MTAIVIPHAARALSLIARRSLSVIMSLTLPISQRPLVLRLALGHLLCSYPPLLKPFIYGRLSSVSHSAL